MFTISQTINLRAENPIKVYEQTLTAGNRSAHTWHVTVMDGTDAADMQGAATMLYITREDGKTVESDRNISISANVVSAVLPAEAYAAEGAVLLEMEITRGDAVVTCAQMGARVANRRTGQIIIPGQGEIYDLQALLREIAAMREATKSADAAAQGAAAAAGSASAAAESAAAAAEAANAWANATATAAGLAAGSAPTVAVTASGGKKVLKFGIPKGDTGATPKLTVTVATGAAGTDAQVTQGGTAENPTLHIVIPRGDTGSIEGLPPMTNDEIDAAIEAGGGTA